MDAYAEPGLVASLSALYPLVTGDLVLDVERAKSRAAAEAAAASAPPPSSPATPPAAAPPPPPPPPPHAHRTFPAIAASTTALSLVDALDARHARLADRTSSLHVECKRLAAEETRLRGIVARIAAPLAHFDAYALLARRLGAPLEPGEADAVDAVAAAVAGANASGGSALAPAPPPVLTARGPLLASDPDFSNALAIIDESVAFLAAHGARFKGATVAIARFSALRLRALGLVTGAVRDAVDAVVVAAERALSVAAAAAATAAAAAAAPNAPPGAAAAAAAAVTALESAEVFQLHVRFRAELGGLRKFVVLIESRGAKRAYGDVLRDLFAAYASQRAALVTPALLAKVKRAVGDRVRTMHESGTSTQPPQPQTVQSANATPGTGASAITSGAAVGVASVHDDAALAPASPISSPTTGGDAQRAGFSASRSSASVYSHAPSTTSTARHTLWAEGVSARERVALDALRNAAAIVSRAVQQEYALFFALFLAAPAAQPHAAAGSDVIHLEGGGGLDDDGGVGGGGAGHLQGVLPSSGASVGTRLTAVTNRTAGTAGSTTGYVRSAADTVLSPFLEDLSGVLADVFRPVLHSVASLDVLVDAAAVLREEVLSDLAMPRGPALAPFARAVASLLGDVQERLAFRAQAFIRDRLERVVLSRAPVDFAIGPAVELALADGRPGRVVGVRVIGDSDSPAINLAFWYRARAAAAACASGAASSSAESIIAVPRPSPIESAFPLLVLTLSFLSRLSRVAERGSFEALAQDAVSACARGLVAAGEARRNALPPADSADGYASARVAIEMNDGVGPHAPGTLTRCLLAGAVLLAPAGAWPAHLQLGSVVPSPAIVTADIDGLLFTVKNLLVRFNTTQHTHACAHARILTLCTHSSSPLNPFSQVLREQLSPYAFSMTATTQSLDFSSTAEALKKLIAHAGSRECPRTFCVLPSSPSLAPSTHPRPLRVDGTVLSMTTENPLLAFLKTGMPRVAEKRVDFKASLEDLLRTTCETLIARVAALLIGRASAFSSRGRAAEKAGTAATPTQAVVAEVLESTRADLIALLPAIRRRLGLYLGSAVTASILFAPIRERVLNELRAFSAWAAAGDTPPAETTAVFDACVSAIEASDSVVTDPTNASFGFDTVVFESRAKMRVGGPGAHP